MGRRSALLWRVLFFCVRSSSTMRTLSRPSTYDPKQVVLQTGTWSHSPALKFAPDGDEHLSTGVPKLYAPDLAVEVSEGLAHTASDEA